jgi:DNA-binding response OmpR family regulator
VILLTAKTGQADRFWGEQAGADAYLCKPVDAALLETELRRLLFG